MNMNYFVGTSCGVPRAIEKLLLPVPHLRLSLFDARLQAVPYFRDTFGALALRGMQQILCILHQCSHVLGQALARIDR
jgi:hypothetical protein